MMSDTFRDDFRKKINSLDDEFIDFCSRVGIRIDSIINDLERIETTRHEVIEELKALKDELW
jgi:hypothetical protein